MKRPVHRIAVTSIAGPDMSIPISFDNISYFGNEFRGDLIITPGVIYYFPHTNVTEELHRPRTERSAVLTVITHSLGFSAAVIHSVATLGAYWHRTMSKSQNRSKLRASGLWKDGESYRELQTRLDNYIDQVRRQPAKLVGYEYELPKPMRFAKDEISNLIVSRGRLRFDSEFDRHDFKIGFRYQRSLRNALWEGNFIQPTAMSHKWAVSSR